ncbi:MAG: pilus assembly protein TadG-related protein [Gemmatimonadota bacterium]|nr:pilus assembly protein TadG-related protein [Gemmatimonadota bacterium]
MRTSRGVVRNERGATIVFVAVCLAAMLSMLALAVDLGMLYKTRGEAQRAADAAALAGAAAFRDAAPAYATVLAHDQAMQLADANFVDGRKLDTLSEVNVEVIPAEAKVRVRVRRAAVLTWFANMFGISSTAVGAKAAAVAMTTGSAKCVKPFALPDLWNEKYKAPRTGQRRETGDTDLDRIWDANEKWNYHPAEFGGTDEYKPFDPTVVDPTQTGYGSAWRDGRDGVTGDKGRSLILKAQSPGDAPLSGWFHLWRLPGNQGGNDVRQFIYGCPDEREVATGDTVDIEPGNTLGPVEQGIDSLIRADAGAYWNPTGGLDGRGAVEGWNRQLYGSDWRNSPRVIKVGVFDPIWIRRMEAGDAKHELTFNNFGMMFLEPIPNGNQANIVARFLYYVSGSGSPGEGTASLTRVLRLVE